MSTGKLSVDQFNALNAMLTQVGLNRIKAQKERGMDDSWSTDRANEIVAYSLVALLTEMGCLPTTVEIDGKTLPGDKAIRFVLCYREPGKEGRFPGWLLQSSTQQKKSVQAGIYPERPKKEGDKAAAKAAEVKSIADAYSSFE